MHKIVLDTGVIFSALAYGGRPKLVMDTCISSKELLLFYSEETFIELNKTLFSDKFSKHSKYPDYKIASFLNRYKEFSEIAVVNKLVTLCRDPKDNIFLSLCLEISADYLITGDKDLHAASEEFAQICPQTKIVTASDFLEAMT